MNRFVMAGRCAVTPVLMDRGTTKLCHLVVIRDEPRTGVESRKVRVQFTAFGSLAETVSKHVLVGDQVLVAARVENNDYTDKESVDRYGFNFVVEEVEFGAPGPKKRAELAARAGG